jgi:20S proteasome alpha/beta subunit
MRVKHGRRRHDHSPGEKCGDCLRRGVTIGIAAICRHKGEDAVVLCYDWQRTTGTFIKAEHTDKMREFKDAAVLLSGDVAAQVEFAARFEEVVREFKAIEKTLGDLDLRVGKYLSKIRNLAATYKRERAEHAIRVRYGLTWTEFHSEEIRKSIPPDRYKTIAEEIDLTDLGGSMIFAYVADEEAFVVTIHRDGTVSWDEEDFALIGSGRHLAMAVTSQDHEIEHMSLEDCLVIVYQAKVLSQNNPGVGKHTTIAVITKGSNFDLTDGAWDFLKNKVPSPIIFPSDPIHGLKTSGLELLKPTRM